MTDDVECPACGADMERKSTGGRGAGGLPQSAHWHTCPECQTVKTEFGGTFLRADLQEDRHD